MHFHCASDCAPPLPKAARRGIGSRISAGQGIGTPEATLPDQPIRRRHGLSKDVVFGSAVGYSGYHTIGRWRPLTAPGAISEGFPIGF